MAKDWGDEEPDPLSIPAARASEAPAASGGATTGSAASGAWGSGGGGPGGRVSSGGGRGGDARSLDTRDGVEVRVYAGTGAGKIGGAGGGSRSTDPLPSVKSTSSDGGFVRNSLQRGVAAPGADGSGYAGHHSHRTQSTPSYGDEVMLNSRSGLRGGGVGGGAPRNGAANVPAHASGPARRGEANEQRDLNWASVRTSDAAASPESVSRGPAAAGALLYNPDKNHFEPAVSDSKGNPGRKVGAISGPINTLQRPKQAPGGAQQPAQGAKGVWTSSTERSAVGDTWGADGGVRGGSGKESGAERRAKEKAARGPRTNGKLFARNGEGVVYCLDDVAPTIASTRSADTSVLGPEGAAPAVIQRDLEMLIGGAVDEPSSRPSNAMSSMIMTTADDDVQAAAKAADAASNAAASRASAAVPQVAYVQTRPFFQMDPSAVQNNAFMHAGGYYWTDAAQQQYMYQQQQQFHQQQMAQAQAQQHIAAHQQWTESRPDAVRADSSTWQTAAASGGAGGDTTSLLSANAPVFSYQPLPWMVPVPQVAPAAPSWPQTHHQQSWEGQQRAQGQMQTQQQGMHQQQFVPPRGPIRQ